MRKKMKKILNILLLLILSMATYTVVAEELNASFTIRPAQPRIGEPVVYHAEPFGGEGKYGGYWFFFDAPGASTRFGDGLTFTNTFSEIGEKVVDAYVRILDENGYVVESLQRKIGFSVANSRDTAITLLSPTGDEVWEVGKIYPITWKAAGSARDVQISLVDHRFNSEIGNAGWELIVDSTPNDGEYLFTVPPARLAGISGGDLGGRNYKVVVTPHGGGESGWSSEFFTLKGGSVPVGLTVTVPPQPSPSLAPLGAARIPFTKVTFSAQADGDVTIDGVVVERVGLSVDAVLDSVMLLDEDGMIMGTPRFLNSIHQATIGGSFIVKAGQSRTLTIAGTRPSWGTASHAGMTVGLSLVQANASVPVSGSFPIAGPLQTINEGLRIGSVWLDRGSMDPGGFSPIIQVGTSRFTFSSVRVTAGSTEDVWLKAIRWYQSGSAVPADLANVRTVVDGEVFETSVSADGNYWTSVFGPEGILIETGFSKEVSIKGDIIGGSGRTVDFDIEQRADLYLEGSMYEFGITAPLGGSVAMPDSSEFSMFDYPWYDASQVTIASGSIQIENSALAPSQDIGVNVGYRTLGGFTATVQGEPISIVRLGFNVTLGGVTGATDVDDITNVSIFDENGAEVAGPFDGIAVDSFQTAGSADGSVVFTDTITFPVGTHSYFIKGKVNTDFPNKATLQFSTTPASDFAIVRGLVTGVNITPSPSASITMNVMTVKSGMLRIALDQSFADKTVIAGAKVAKVGIVVLDATDSGEDIRIITLPLELSGRSVDFSATDLTNCQLYDGATSVTTWSNVKNPSFLGLLNFNFDGTGLIIPKGTVKTLVIRADVRTSATSSFSIDLKEPLSYNGVTGLQTAQWIRPEFMPSRGAVMTIVPHGEVKAKLDPTTPTNAPVDTTDATVLKFQLEPKIEKVALRGMVIDSQVFKGDKWVSLSEYLAYLVVGSVRVETGAIPYPSFEAPTVGRLYFVFPPGVGTDVPFELEVDTTGFPTNAKVRFTLVEANVVGEYSGARYDADVTGVVSEVMIVESPVARIQSFTVIGSAGVGVKFAVLRAKGLPQKKYNLEASLDLKTWTEKPWLPTTADAEGNVDMEFELFPTVKEFFRIVSVVP